MAKQTNMSIKEGYLIAPPVARKATEAGGAVTSFAVRVNNSYVNKNGEEIDKSILRNIVCFGRVAEIAMLYCTTGTHVLITGEDDDSKYTPEGSTTPQIRTQIVVSNINGLRLLTPASGSTKSVLEKVENDMESVLAMKKSWEPAEVIELLKNAMEKARPTTRTNGNTPAPTSKKQVTEDAGPPPDEAFV